MQLISRLYSIYDLLDTRGHMEPRRRGTRGKTIPWTDEQLRAGFDYFHRLHGKYPTASEIDEFEYLPTARTLQRSLGGLVAVRTRLSLSGDADLRTGKHSIKRAHTINARAHEIEELVYEYLVEHFGKPFVHREYFFTDDKRTRADFFVHDASGGFCTDVFYPSTFKNFLGCVNSKERKYAQSELRQYPIYFLYLNDEIYKERIVQWLAHKKKALPEKVQIIHWKDYRTMCSTRKRLTLT